MVSAVEVDIFAATWWRCHCGATARDAEKVWAHRNRCLDGGPMTPFVRIIGLRWPNEPDDGARELAESVAPGSTADWAEKPEYPLWQEFIY